MAPSDIDTLVKIITMEVLAGVDKSLEKNTIVRGYIPQHSQVESKLKYHWKKN